MQPKKRVLLSLLLFTLIVTGCAKIIHKPVASADDNNGLRYYNSSPYVLLYSNGKGGIISQIIYLPDPHSKMTASPKSFLSSIQATLEFDKGVLKSAKNTVDATVIPSAIVSAMKTAAPAFLAAMNEPAQARVVPAPYLYKIIVRTDKVSFIGDKGDIDVKVNVLKQEEKPK
jgi:hypothetical protein